jgi:glycine reductase
MRELEKEGVFRKFHETYYSTVGNGTSVANASRFGSEIAQKLKEQNVDAVIVTST